MFGKDLKDGVSGGRGQHLAGGVTRLVTSQRARPLTPLHPPNFLFSALQDDIALMKDMKLNHYRFSISWPRILPTGRKSEGLERLEFITCFVFIVIENVPLVQTNTSTREGSNIMTA